MTILGVSHGSVSDTDRLGNRCVETPAGTIQLGQNRRQLPRRETFEIGNLRQIDRTHVRIVPRGCHAVDSPPSEIR